MGRKRTTLAIDPVKLREAVAGRETWSDYAEKFGVTKQAISAWLSEGRIPARALIEIARDLDLAPEVVEAILEPSTRAHAQKRKWTITLTVEEGDSDA